MPLFNGESAEAQPLGLTAVADWLSDSIIDEPEAAGSRRAPPLTLACAGLVMGNRCILICILLLSFCTFLPLLYGPSRCQNWLRFSVLPRRCHAGQPAQRRQKS